MPHSLPTTIVVAISFLLSSQCRLAYADQTPVLDHYQQLLADFGSTNKAACSAAQSAWQNICFELGRAAHDALRAEACEQMCASLTSGQPRESTLFILRQLERIGRDESVATLQMLTSSDDHVVADAARRALQNIPTDSAREALVALLNETAKNDFKINVIYSLGYRAEPKSVSALVSHLENGTPQVQLAAAKALARFDTQLAAKAVFAAWQSATGAQADQLVGSVIVMANRVAKQGNPTGAAPIFRTVYDRSVNPAVRAAAFKGHLVSAGGDTVELMVKSLSSDNALEQQVAIGHVSELTNDHLALLINSLSRVPPTGRASLLFALGANRKTSALPAIEQACKSNNIGVQIAAITALGHVGSAAHTQLLLDQLHGDEQLRSAATKSLSMIFDDEVDRVLLQRLAALDADEQREELISILFARSCPALAQVMVDSNAIVSPNAETRKRATEILHRLGTVEHIPALITSMTKNPTSEQDATAKTIVSICSRIANADEQAAPVVNMYATAPNEIRPHLLSVVGRIGGRAAGEFVSSKIASDTAIEKDAVITAICNWPDDSVSDQLLTIARSGDTAAQRSRAIRAIARVVVLPSSRHSLDEQLSILQQTMRLATQDDERKLILDRAKAIGLLSTVEFVRAYLQSSALSQPAQSSLVYLARIRELRQADPSIRVDLEHVLKNSADSKLRERAKQLLLEY